MTMRSINPKTTALLVGTLIQLAVVGSYAADNPLSQLFNSDNSRTTKMSEVATLVATLNENMEVGGLDFSPDGKFLAATSTSDSDEVHVWDWGRKDILHKMKKGGGASGGDKPEPLRYSPDGRYLAACHSRAERNSVIHIWDAQTGSLAHDIDEPETGRDCTAVGFTPDGLSLVRIGEIGPRPKDSIIVYDTRNWQLDWSLRTLPFYPSTLAISPDGKFAATGGGNFGPGVPHQPQILIVDLAKRAIVKTIDAFPVENEVRALAWHPDGVHLAASTRIGGKSKGPDVARIFDALTGNIVVAATPKWPSHVAASINVMRYSPDGKYLAESGATVVKEGIYRHVHIWDGRRQTLLQEIHAEPGAMAFSRDGKFLAMGGDRKILIWQMK